MRQPGAGVSGPPAAPPGDAEFRAIADTAPAVLWVTEPSGACTFLSRAWYELTGQCEGSALGYGWVDAVHPEDREASREIFLAANARREPFQLDYRLLDAKGRYRRAIDAGRPRFGSGGEFLGFVGSVIDISERHELEEQLRQAQKMEAVGRLAGGVAHDFNNLLMVIRGYVEVLQAELEPRPQELAEIAWAADRAAELTQQLMAIGRKQVQSVTLLELNAIVRESEALLRRTIEEHIRIEVDLHPDAGAVRVDRGQILQVLLNLALNARDAMPQGGTLTIRTAPVSRGAARGRGGTHAMLAVADTGTGITDEVRPHIFEPFFTTKENWQGTGLGLPTVYGIIKQSGGDIEVRTKPGRGTTMCIYLPRLEPPPVPAADESSEPAFVERTTGSETILLVEDEPSVRQLAARVLRTAGYAVVEAPGGNEALALAAAHAGPLDLLVTDIVMPGVSGAELASRLAETRPELPVVFLSGYLGHRKLERELKNGALLLQKPFTIKALLKKVRQALER